MRSGGQVGSTILPWFFSESPFPQENDFDIDQYSRDNLKHYFITRPSTE